MKIFKILTPSFLHSITKLFNDSLSPKEANRIPVELKTAVVTALYKGKKLDLSDVNSYRGISVLAILAKVFEKIFTKIF